MNTHRPTKRLLLPALCLGLLQTWAGWICVATTAATRNSVENIALCILLICSFIFLYFLISSKGLRFKFICGSHLFNLPGMVPQGMEPTAPGKHLVPYGEAGLCR